MVDFPKTDTATRLPPELHKNLRRIIGVESETLLETIKEWTVEELHTSIVGASNVYARAKVASMLADESTNLVRVHAAMVLFLEELFLELERKEADSKCPL